MQVNARLCQVFFFYFFLNRKRFLLKKNFFLIKKKCFDFGGRKTRNFAVNLCFREQSRTGRERQNRAVFELFFRGKSHFFKFRQRNCSSRSCKPSINTFDLSKK